MKEVGRGEIMQGLMSHHKKFRVCSSCNKKLLEDFKGRGHLI